MPPFLRYARPALASAQHWRLFFVERYAGTQAYKRLQWSVMNNAEGFDTSIWREPAPFDLEDCLRRFRRSVSPDWRRSCHNSE